MKSVYFTVFVICLLIYFSLSYFFIEKFLVINFKNYKTEFFPDEKVYLEAVLTNYNIYSYDIMHSDPLFFFEVYKDGKLIFIHPDVVVTIGRNARLYPFKKYNDQNTIEKNKFLVLSQPGIYEIICVMKFRLKEKEINIKSKPIHIIVKNNSN